MREPQDGCERSTAVQPSVGRIARLFAHRTAQIIGAEQALAQYRGVDRHRHVADERKRQGTFDDRVEGSRVTGIDAQLPEMDRQPHLGEELRHSARFVVARFQYELRERAHRHHFAV